MVFGVVIYEIHINVKFIKLQPHKFQIGNDESVVRSTDVDVLSIVLVVGVDVLHGLLRPEVVRQALNSVRRVAVFVGVTVVLVIVDAADGFDGLDRDVPFGVDAVVNAVDFVRADLLGQDDLVFDRHLHHHLWIDLRETP